MAKDYVKMTADLQAQLKQLKAEAAQEKKDAYPALMHAKTVVINNGSSTLFDWVMDEYFKAKKAAEDEAKKAEAEAKNKAKADAKTAQVLPGVGSGGAKQSG